MRTERRSVFETNSSSSHSITYQSKSTKSYITLNKDGYVYAGFGDYYDEEMRDIYKTMEDKLRFLLSVLVTILEREKRNKNIKSSKKRSLYESLSEECRLTKDELKNSEEYQEIERLIKNKIPDCKGLRFRRHSFSEEGYCEGGVDGHHLHFSGYDSEKYAYTFKEFLDYSGLSLENYLFSPHITVEFNKQSVWW